MCYLLCFLVMGPCEVNVERQEVFPGEYSYLCTSDRTVLIPREGPFFSTESHNFGREANRVARRKRRPLLSEPYQSNQL